LQVEALGWLATTTNAASIGIEGLPGKLALSGKLTLFISLPRSEFV